MDDEAKLTLHGLQQHFVKLEEVGKNRKLNDLLDTLEFNQVRLGVVWDAVSHGGSGCHLCEIGGTRGGAG